LINDILDISKIEAGRLVLKRATVPPAELVHQSIAAMETPPDVAVTATVADPIPDVYVDPDRILQALLNLLSNAAKFAPAGSTVEVAVTRDGDGFVRFSVTDHGAGISPDQMNRLFRRFQQLDASTTRRTAGTGARPCHCQGPGRGARRPSPTRPAPSSPEVSRRPPQVTPGHQRPAFCSVFCGHAI
jgi:signal transduction histidine kinase